MGYNTRSKKIEKGQGDMKVEPTQENWIDDKSSELLPNESNSSNEDKENVTSQSESKIVTTERLITNELGNISHNLDDTTLFIREDPAKFNESTIYMLEVGMTIKGGNMKNEYRVICKIGLGGSSIVWLIFDMKTNEFKVAKLFKFKKGVTVLELKTLLQIQKHPNILRFYENLDLKYGETLARVGIFEPLGKDLNILMKEASKHGGLSISVVKKVAKHVLLALKTVHDLKVVHSDIKLPNVATCISQLSLRCLFEKIVESMKSGKNLSSLRMVCDKSEFDPNQKGKLLEKEHEEVLKLELKDEKELIFKLIDFGNVSKEGVIKCTGTFGFHPPEYFFGAPLLSSYDIWSLGVTIVVLLTNEMFLMKGYEEINAIRCMFGKLSRHHFKDFKDPNDYKTKLTTRFYSSLKAKEQLQKLLEYKFEKLPMDDNDRKELIDFLIQMLNTLPNERKSAEEMLCHHWLNAGRDEHQHENIHNTNISLKHFPSNDPKHSKKSCKHTRKIKEATKDKRRYDSFIYKENDGEFYLYHKYYRIPYREDKDLFECPKCFYNIRIQPKIGFVLVSDKEWHKPRCIISYKQAPPEGHRMRVRYKPANQNGFKFRVEVITNEEVDRKRKSLENQGYKPMFDSGFPDVICEKETEINEFDDLYYEKSSVKTDDTVDSDSDETEEDSLKTISDFGSGESYYDIDSSSSIEILSDEEFNEGFDDEIGETIEGRVA